MKQSETIANLAAALVKAQTEIKAVGKDATNPDFRSRYASLDAIIDHVRPVLARHGLALLQGATTPHTDEVGHMTTFAVETMLVHSSGEWICNTAIMPVVGRMLKGGGLGDVTPQSAGGALTYGRRYGLSALLTIATDDDDDGNAASRPAREETHAASASTNGASSPPAKAASAPVAYACPTCAGPMWDNRLDKRNPRAPDWKCKDRSCDGVIWPPKEEKFPASARANNVPPDEDYPGWTPNEEEIPF